MTVFRVLGEVLRLVVVEPVRTGRLRAHRWPAGLAATVALGLVAFAVAATLVVTAPLVRRNSELVAALGGADLVMPRWTVPVFLLLVVLTLALLHAASLHLAPWVRLLTLLALLLGGPGAVSDVASENTGATVSAGVGAALLVLLTAVRWRAAYRWWEFAASFVVLGATIAVTGRLVAERVQSLGYDTAPQSLVLVMQLVANLAIPFTFVAGLAFAQLALLLTDRVAAVVDERVRPARAVAVVVAVLGVTAVALAVRRLRQPSGSGDPHAAELAVSALLLALAVGSALLLAVRRAEPLEGLESPVTALALPIAFAITAPSLVAILLLRLDNQLVRLFPAEGLRADRVVELVSATTTVGWVRIVVGVLLLAWAVRRRHRAPLAATFAVTVGWVLLVTALSQATQRAVDLAWTSAALTDVATLGWLVALVVLLVLRRLDRRRLVLLGTGLGLSLAFSVRSAFDAPFVSLLGLGGSAAVFVGLLWALLTGAGDANEDSPRYPRPARVLFFLANALLAMTTLAFTAVADTAGYGIDVSPFGALGDDFLGTGLLLAAYAVLVQAALSSRRRSPSSSPRTGP